jgi:hypothetical protein
MKESAFRIFIRYFFIFHEGKGSLRASLPEMNSLK